MDDLTRFQQKLGYHFSNVELLKQAVTHRSVGKPNNERLEYLGDSVIGFFIAYSLYVKFPQHPEGDLTKMRAKLVRKSTLSEIARDFNISDIMVMGGGEMKSGGYNRDSVLSDAFESVVGAVYLDGGIAVVQEMLENIYSELLSKISPQGLKDSKTQLQEYLQKHSLSLPEYKVVEEIGEAHNLIFMVECRVPECDEFFRASGTSRKLAEQQAAQSALEHLTKHAS